MEKVLLFLVVCVVVKASNRPHPKFPKSSEEYYDKPLHIKVVACSSEHDSIRSNIIEESRCGEPRDYFLSLNPRATFEQISPGAVWVKRCQGLCEYDAVGSRCVATKTITRHIPVKIFNLKTNKESCSTYPVEEHVSCGCCSLSPEECAAPRVYSPRKCSCQCPNLEDRRDCQRKRNQNMRWNRSKCACELRRRVP